MVRASKILGGNSLRKTYIDNRSDDLGYGSLLRHVRMGDFAN